MLTNQVSDYINLVTIAASSGLSDKEIEKMVSQAEEFAEADKIRKDTIEAINSAEGIINQTEKAMKDFKDKIDTEASEAITLKMTELREIISKGSENTTAEAVKEKADAVQEASLKLFQKVYEAKAAEGKSTESEPADAEFKDAKDSKDSEKTK